MKHLLCIWLVVLPWTAVSQDLPKSELTISAGYLFEGEIYVNPPNQYGSVGETLLLKVDFVGYLSDYIGLGGYVAYGNPYYWAFGEISMAEFGLVVKPRFRAGEQFVFKLPVYAGYRTYGNSAGSGFAANLSGVLEYQMDKVRPFIDVGMMTQPVGGNSAADMTFSPTFQVSLGVAIPL